MCRAQCVTAFLALSVTFVNSWDIALTTGDQIEFLNNGKVTNSEGRRFRDLTALAYDAVHNMLLFVDKQSDNASIFSYHLATKKYQPLVRRRSYENIQGLAFDPVSMLLFWTDTTEKSILYKSLAPDATGDVYGNLLFKLDDEIPRAIAVDSCRGYIYWTNINTTKATIERAKLDGTEREVVVGTDIHMPATLAIDQRTKKLYWIDDKEGIHYSIESSDLDGKNRNIILTGVDHQPNALTVSKDTMYWIDWDQMSVWKLDKSDSHSAKPTKVMPLHAYSFGIVANYPIADQTENVPECEELTKLSQNSSSISHSFNIPKDAGLYCLHGIKVGGTMSCNCSAGYTGERCEISICRNYCFHGDCSLTTEGGPQCRCQNGFIGSRCETNVCEGHCLNNGQCRSQEGNRPFCTCSPDYEGQRCETVKHIAKETTVAPPTTAQEETCNCSKDQNTTSSKDNYISGSESITANDGDFVESSACADGWDPIRDPIIMVLGILSGLMCVACAVLITKILHLRRRPRIKKRIIVNKNVTPLTARPDQCEITIENCCNMNICETPCFEPRSTIRPTLLDAKPGKEEKKNLIANMEYPDDY